jgi:hypothetical protein
MPGTDDYDIVIGADGRIVVLDYTESDSDWLIFATLLVAVCVAGVTGLRGK